MDSPTAVVPRQDARIAQASRDLVQLQPVAATLAKQSQFILFFGQQNQQSSSLSSVSWRKRYPVREASRGWPNSSLVRGWRSSVFFRGMIPLLQGWSIVTRGIGLTLTPPEGVACGAIGYDERRRPLRPIASLLAEASTYGPRFVVTKQRGPERLTTHEGEYAALVVQDGVLDEGARLVQRSIGYVFGDDFYARIVGLALRTEQFVRFEAQVRQLILQDRHHLGLRRRRFLFTPPVGYFGIERSPLHAYYYGPGYPRDPAVMVVYPALPRSMWQADDLPQHLRPIQGLSVQAASGPFQRSTATLTGDTWTLHGLNDERRAMTRTLVVLEDDRYVYPLSLDVADANERDHVARFWALVDSVQRLPGPLGVPLPPDGDRVFGHFG